MPSEFPMPQLSDTMTEGTVVKWRKQEGEKVKAGEIIAEIETDKAVMESEAFVTGTVASLLVQEGQKVPVGTLLAVVATAGENPADVKKKYAGGAASGAAAQGGATTGSAVGDAGRPATTAPPAVAAGVAAAAGGGTTLAESAARTPTLRGDAPGANRVPAPTPGSQGGAVHTLAAASISELHEPDEAGHGATRERATAVPAIKNTGGGNGNGHRVFASPLAKRIAADKGIDLSQLQGSGPGGRIVQKDVLAYAERPAAPATAAAPTEQKPEKAAPALPVRVPRGQSEVVPVTKMRAAIAGALQKSKQQIPHFYVTVDVDVEDLMALRARVNKQLESDGVKLSLNGFVSKAVAAALLKHPAVNAHWTGDSITRFGDVHLGIAVAIPDGLIVPVIRHADQMGLRELQQRTADLAKKARATPPRLKEDEMKGATFTISNLGMYGVKAFDAIINPPAVAILAVAGAEKRPVVRGDQIVARTIMSLTLSVDHRAVDGATAAEFLRTLKGLLEEPGMMLV